MSLPQKKYPKKVILVKDPLTVSELGFLKEDLVRQLKESLPVLLDLSEVRTYDSVGLQFLVAITEIMKLNGRSIEYDGMTSEIDEAAKTIGISFSTNTKTKTG